MFFELSASSAGGAAPAQTHPYLVHPFSGRTVAGTRLCRAEDKYKHTLIYHFIYTLYMYIYIYIYLHIYIYIIYNYI